MRGNAAAQRAARTPLHGRHTRCAGPRAAKGRTGRSRRVPTSHAGNKGAEGERCPEGCRTGGPRREERHSGIAASTTQGTRVTSRSHLILRRRTHGARARLDRRAPARTRTASEGAAPNTASGGVGLLLLHEGWKPAGPRRRSARERTGGSACDSPAVCPQTACRHGRVRTTAPNAHSDMQGCPPGTPA